MLGGVIYFDVTKSGSARHQSGLMRVSARLRDELGDAAVPVAWDDGFHEIGSRVRLAFRPQDWLFTTELFSEPERPGFWAFLREHPCRLGAMFADAIPLQHPSITWPQSVARHPEYMKMLGSFDRVWAISNASCRALTSFWDWQGGEVRARVETVLLGSDFDRRPRATTAPEMPAAGLILCVGIVEPRKNQTLLIDACQQLWAEGLDFELHVVGRVNPHFGKPIAERIEALRRAEPRVHAHEGLSDAILSQLYSRTTAAAFPTIAEGCGLPVLESLWRGRPCVCSDLPVLREIAEPGGCLMPAPNDRAAWAGALRTVLTDRATWNKLAGEAVVRRLPTWTDTAHELIAGMS